LNEAAMAQVSLSQIAAPRTMKRNAKDAVFASSAQMDKRSTSSAQIMSHRRQYFIKSPTQYLSGVELHLLSLVHWTLSQQTTMHRLRVSRRENVGHNFNPRSSTWCLHHDFCKGCENLSRRATVHICPPEAAITSCAGSEPMPRLTRAAERVGEPCQHHWFSLSLLLLLWWLLS